MDAAANCPLDEAAIRARWHRIDILSRRIIDAPDADTAEDTHLLLRLLDSELGSEPGEDIVFGLAEDVLPVLVRATEALAISARQVTSALQTACLRARSRLLARELLPRLQTASPSALNDEWEAVLARAGVVLEGRPTSSSPPSPHERGYRSLAAAVLCGLDGCPEMAVQAFLREARTLERAPTGLGVLVGGDEPFVVQIHVDIEHQVTPRSDIDLRVSANDPRTRAAVADAVRAVTELFERWFALPLCGLKVIVDVVGLSGSHPVGIHGNSLGLPTALSLVARLARLPMPEGVASTGVLVRGDTKFTVNSVGGWETKQKVFELQPARHVRRLLCPDDGNWNLEQTGIEPVVDLDDAVDRVFGRERLAKSLLAQLDLLESSRPAESYLEWLDQTQAAGRAQRPWVTLTREGARETVSGFISQDRASALLLVGESNRGKSTFLGELVRQPLKHCVVFPFRCVHFVTPEPLAGELASWGWFFRQQDLEAMDADSHQAKMLGLLRRQVAALASLARQLNSTVLLAFDGFNELDRQRRTTFARWFSNLAASLKKVRGAKLLLTSQRWACVSASKDLQLDGSFWYSPPHAPSQLVSAFGVVELPLLSEEQVRATLSRFFEGLTIAEIPTAFREPGHLRRLVYVAPRELFEGSTLHIGQLYQAMSREIDAIEQKYPGVRAAIHAALDTLERDVDATGSGSSLQWDRHFTIGSGIRDDGTGLEWTAAEQLLRIGVLARVTPDTVRFEKQDIVAFLRADRIFRDLQADDASAFIATALTMPDHRDVLRYGLCLAVDRPRFFEVMVRNKARRFFGLVHHVLVFALDGRLLDAKGVDRMLVRHLYDGSFRRAAWRWQSYLELASSHGLPETFALIHAETIRSPGRALVQLVTGGPPRDVRGQTISCALTLWRKDAGAAARVLEALGSRITRSPLLQPFRWFRMAAFCLPALMEWNGIGALPARLRRLWGVLRSLGLQRRLIVNSAAFKTAIALTRVVPHEVNFGWSTVRREMKEIRSFAPRLRPLMTYLQPGVTESPEVAWDIISDDLAMLEARISHFIEPVMMRLLALEPELGWARLIDLQQSASHRRGFFGQSPLTVMYFYLLHHPELGQQKEKTRELQELVRTEFFTRGARWKTLPAGSILARALNFRRMTVSRFTGTRLPGHIPGEVLRIHPAMIANLLAQMDFKQEVTNCQEMTNYQEVTNWQNDLVQEAVTRRRDATERRDFDGQKEDIIPPLIVCQETLATALGDPLWPKGSNARAICSEAAFRACAALHRSDVLVPAETRAVEKTLLHLACFRPAMLDLEMDDAPDRYVLGKELRSTLQERLHSPSLDIKSIVSLGCVLAIS